MEDDSEFMCIGEEQTTPSSSTSQSTSVMNSSPSDRINLRNPLVHPLLSFLRGIIFVLLQQSFNLACSKDQCHSNQEQLFKFINGLIGVDQFISYFQVNSFLLFNELTSPIKSIIQVSLEIWLDMRGDRNVSIDEFFQMIPPDSHSSLMEIDQNGENLEDSHEASVDLSQHQNKKLSFMESFRDAICPVCLKNLNEFEQKEVMVMSKCGHMMCVNCLKILKQLNKNECPVCRRKGLSNSTNLHPSFDDS